MVAQPLGDNNQDGQKVAGRVCVTKNKRNNSAKNAQRSPYVRSRVTQGLNLLPTIDGRSAHARVFKDTYEAMVAHCGGEAAIPETMRLMCRRAAALETELINLECRFAQLRSEGQEPKANDIDLHSRLTNTLRRVCEVIGWNRQMRDMTPTLSEYLEIKSRQAKEAEVETFTDDKE